MRLRKAADEQRRITPDQAFPELYLEFSSRVILEVGEVEVSPPPGKQLASSEARTTHEHDRNPITQLQLGEQTTNFFHVEVVGNPLSLGAGADFSDWVIGDPLMAFGVRIDRGQQVANFGLRARRGWFAVDALKAT